MKTAKPVEKDNKPQLIQAKKQKLIQPVVVSLSEVEVVSSQTQKPEPPIVKSESTNNNSNIVALHGSQTIYHQGSEIMYKRLQESLAQTGDINHPDTKEVERGYMRTLSINQARDYHDFKSGTYLPKTVEEQVMFSQMVKNKRTAVKTTGEKETLKKINNKSEETEPIINQKSSRNTIEINTPSIASTLSESNKSNSHTVTDKNATPHTEKVKIKDEKKSNEKKINTKTTSEKESNVVIPKNIQPVVTPRMDKAVDSEQAEIAADAQTTINIVGLVAAAQEFRDQGLEARSQVKTQNQAANTLKNKIKEVQKEIQKSDADLEKSEDSIESKETLIRKLEKGLETSVKRQQKVEQEVGIYQQEYNKNKTKANDFNNEAKNLLGGSQKHQDPKNADSGTLTKKLNELNTNAGTINQAVTQAGNTTQKLSQEAQQAKGKNAKIKSEILSSRASILKSKAKLASDNKKNKEAKTELGKLSPKLKQVESQSKKLNQEADGLLKDSYAIEHEVIKTQNAYYANMATVEGRNSLIQKEKDKIQNTPKELNQAERLLIDFAQLKTEDEQVVFIRKLNPSEQNLLRDKLKEVNANYDNDQSEHQELIDQNVESIRDSQIEVFNNKRKDTLQKPLNLVTKNLNRITGLKRLWMSISIAFSDIWNDITGITWTDVGKFIKSIFNPKEWAENISDSISGIWDDLTNWKGFSQDPVGMILQKAAGIANKVLTIAGVITGILGILTIAAAAGAIFTLGGLGPLAAWLGGATITMGTITFWIGAIALGLNLLNGIKNIYDVHTAKTAEVLFKNSGELKSDITNSGMAILAMIGGKASKKGGASIKDLAKRNPKTFGKRMFITARNGIKASIVSIPRKITSVFKKETWIKASQRFKTAYKKAQEWITEPFKKNSTTPPSRNLNQLPFEEQTVPDRMHEQPIRNEKSNGKSNIKEENVKPIQTQENIYEESIFRQDNKPYSPEGSKEGRIKSHINEEGNLTPADKNGSATVSDHVRGSEPMKSKSPYTSFSDEGPGIGKTYGDNVIEVDIKKLEADIAAGKISEVEVLRPEKVQAELQAKIDQAMKRFDENPTPKNQKRVDDAVRDLNNSIRDKEILVKGEIPSEYFNVKSTKNNIPENISPEIERNKKGTGKSNIKKEDVKPIQTEHGKSYGQAKTHEGHTVTMTEKGEIYICASPCEPIREKYTLELEQNPELSRQINDLEADITLTDQEKADWISKEIEPKLSKIKKDNKVTIEENLNNVYKTKQYVKVKKRDINDLLTGKDVTVKSFKEANQLLEEAFPNAKKVRGAGPKDGKLISKQKKLFKLDEKRTPTYHKDYLKNSDDINGSLYGHEELGINHPHKTIPHINILTSEGKKVTIYIKN